MQEEWRSVHPKYEVSNLGRLRNVSDPSNPRIVNGGRNQWGHRMVCIDRRTRYIHRLVLEAFVGPCPQGMECRHLDGNAGNNVLSNLAWGTHLENEADRVRHGTLIPARIIHRDRTTTRARGSKQWMAKFTEDQIVEIRKRILEGERPCDLAREFNVCPATICYIRKGRTWMHVTH